MNYHSFNDKVEKKSFALHISFGDSPSLVVAYLKNIVECKQVEIMAN